MSLLLIIFGLFSGCFLAILVGLIGSRRTLGFGWAFVISLLLTPLIGLICALLSDPLPYSGEYKMGCLGTTLAILGAVMVIPLVMFLMALFSMIFV